MIYKIFREKTPKEVPAKATPQATASIPERTPIPAWLTQDHFEDIVKKDVSDFRAIKSYKVGAATVAGDNYASSILKIDIEAEKQNGSLENVNYMLKVPVTGEHVHEMTASMETFKKEALFYHDLKDKFENIYQQHGKKVEFGPKGHSFTKPVEVPTVLMKNLRPEGYKNANRFEGLDLEHTKLVLEKVAQLHAVSATYYAQGNHMEHSLTQSMYSEKSRPFMEKISKSFFGSMLKCYAEYENNEEYLPLMVGLFKLLL